MALKDWKKIIDRKDKIEFMNNENKRYFIQIYHIPENWFGNKNKEHYSVRMYYGIDITYKDFQNKQQALKYVKAYMRKH